MIDKSAYACCPLGAALLVAPSAPSFAQVGGPAALEKPAVTGAAQGGLAGMQQPREKKRILLREQQPGLRRAPLRVR